MTSSEVWQVVKGDSDKETTPGSSPRTAVAAVASCKLGKTGRMQEDSEDEFICHVVVKSTFIEVTNGSSMMQRFKKFRKTGCSSGKTTVMMRNIPNNYTRKMFLELLNKHGLQSCYDFIYLPYDFQRDSNLGYAFVNLREESWQDAVDMFWRTFDGFSQWSLPSSKVCKVTWSGPHQGFEAHERARGIQAPDFFRRDANSLPSTNAAVESPNHSMRWYFSCTVQLGKQVKRRQLAQRPAQHGTHEGSDVTAPLAFEPLIWGLSAHLRTQRVMRSGGGELEEHMTFAGEFESPPEENLNSDLSQQLVVKSTFLDVTDGLSAMQRFMRLRRAKSDCADPTLGWTFKLSHQELNDDAEEDRAVTLAAATEAEESEDSEIPEPQGRTTVCLRNVPNNYTRQMLLELLEEQGLSGHFDFLYLPCDFHRHANLGYAFVNLVDEASVMLFWRILDGFTGWALPTAKVGKVSFSGPHQGLLAHIERYRNSPLPPNADEAAFSARPMYSSGLSQRLSNLEAKLRCMEAEGALAQTVRTNYVAERSSKSTFAASSG
eukprot:s363_g5.t1